jgi:hypothetical protein
MLSNGDNWEAYIPAQSVGSIIEYYIEGESLSGKTQVRPMPAPEGFWSFKVLDVINGIAEFTSSTISRIYPNPASAITCIEINNKTAVNTVITLVDMTGRTVHTVHNGIVRRGSSNFFFNAEEFESGVYQVTIQTPNSISSMPILIH